MVFILILYLYCFLFHKFEHIRDNSDVNQPSSGIKSAHLLCSKGKVMKTVSSEMIKLQSNAKMPLLDEEDIMILVISVLR